MSEFIYHRCVEQSIGWFQAYGWDLVNLYEDCGVPMALMKHVDIPEDDEE